MRIGVLATGTVGQTLGTKLASLGHEVTMGARDASNDDSLAEQIQRAFAGASVVKALNTVTGAVTVDPAWSGTAHAVPGGRRRGRQGAGDRAARVLRLAA